jgi:phage terminase small subunit
MPSLTLKERAFVSAIAVPGSPSFGNGTQSALRAGYADTAVVAGKRAYDLRRKPEIHSAIEDLFKKHNVGIEERTKAMTEILSQRYTEIEQLSADGELISKTRMSADKMRLATIRELNKMDGTYARAEAVGKAQGKVLEPMIEEYTRRLRAELRTASESAVEGQGEAQDTLPALSPPTSTEPATDSVAEPTEQSAQEQEASKLDESVHKSIQE